MPLIAAPLDRHGAVIDLLVGVGPLRRAALEQQGMPVPPPVAVRTQIDTGSSVTGFAPQVFAALSLRPVGTIPILTPSTPHDAPLHCNEYFVSLAVVANGTPYPFVETARVIAALGWAPGDDVQGLIGRDVLAHCTFMYFGTEGRFQFAM